MRPARMSFLSLQESSWCGRGKSRRNLLKRPFGLCGLPWRGRGHPVSYGIIRCVQILIHERNHLGNEIVHMPHILVIFRPEGDITLYICQLYLSLPAGMPSALTEPSFSIYLLMSFIVGINVTRSDIDVVYEISGRDL